MSVYLSNVYIHCDLAKSEAIRDICRCRGNENGKQIYE